jgi:N6-L-threonylcarbamoyladenine synthase
VTEVLVAKTMLAARQTGVRTVVVGGGVAANKALRTHLSAACEANGLTLHLTPMRYCTDNGVMIAYLGDRLLSAGRVDSLGLDVRATS